MGKIIVSENVTIDGVVQDPIGESAFDHSGWFNRLPGLDREAWAAVLHEEAVRAAALLMGRRTYEWFVGAGWPSRTGAWADRLRTLPKHVVATDLRAPTWENTTVVDSAGLKSLEADVDGDIVVYGSGRLVRTLFDVDLVDELRLMVCPVVLGSGAGLFAGVTGELPMQLVDARTVGGALALLTYRRP
ncbi:dihydrofolate reductase family protein [Pseudonocardia sp. TRM90224]|uniref:dihydrofolate reductase family protein n=1 Tax=Pseudonocardia sp. TRM90224 TaxID=2812678 RepID=UPI001E43AE0E|nr:dihydrofolate reductase family protein [Pseudonocardia sp. TRM90224]